MIIIHGEDQSASRNYFLDIKHQKQSEGKQIVDLPGQGLTLRELQVKSQTSSLLGETNSIFIEDFFSGRPGREKTLISDFLSGHSAEDITVWESKDISVHLKKFQPALVKKFDLPKYIFQFLDHPTQILFHQSLLTTAPEQLFALLVGHFRKLIMVKCRSGNFPVWQQQKLALQASRYDISRLFGIYRELLEIDYRTKTSSTSQNLSFSLELWLARL